MLAVVMTEPQSIASASGPGGVQVRAPRRDREGSAIHGCFTLFQNETWLRQLAALDSPDAGSTPVA
jgi:hypothetical protein